MRPRVASEVPVLGLLVQRAGLPCHASQILCQIPSSKLYRSGKHLLEHFLLLYPTFWSSLSCSAILVLHLSVLSSSCVSCLPCLIFLSLIGLGTLQLPQLSRSHVSSLLRAFPYHPLNVSASHVFMIQILMVRGHYANRC